MIEYLFNYYKDIRLVYDMLVSEAIYDYMFNEEHPGLTWQEFSEDEVDFFIGRAVPDDNHLGMGLGAEAILQ